MNKNLITETDQIRNMLGKVRLIQENAFSQPAAPVATQQQPQQTPAGEKIQFDGINTVGFMNAQNLRDDVKRSVTTAVGEFLKASGLILDTVNLNVQDSKVMITSDTIKNPGISAINSITFDTSQESPSIQVVAGTMSLDNDLIVLLQSVAKSFTDNQIGRNALISATQGNI